MKVKLNLKKKKTKQQIHRTLRPAYKDIKPIQASNLSLLSVPRVSQKQAKQPAKPLQGWSGLQSIKETPPGLKRPPTSLPLLALSPTPN